MNRLILFISDITIQDNGTAQANGGFFDANATNAEVLRKGIDQLLYVTAAISIIVLIISGLRYAISAGNPGAIKSAKDGIVYAVVGLVVAAAGYAIALFVAGSFK